MNRIAVLKHEFVEFIPDELEPATIYISIASPRHRTCAVAVAATRS
jgi:hypothetical protein